MAGHALRLDRLPPGPLQRDRDRQGRRHARIGAGQISRVDSVRLAVEKCRDARDEEAGALLADSALASDAFFPFADGPELALEAGATAVIQPGGSKRDAEVIEPATPPASRWS